MRTKELVFKEKTYNIAYTDVFDWHPSHHYFDDESSVRDHFWLIEPGDIVFDIGASYGSYTLTALLEGADMVYAWSPQSHGFMSEKLMLEESLRLNGWSDRCIVYDTGIFDKTGWLDTMTQEFHQDQPTAAKSSHSNADDDIIRVESFDDWYAHQGLNVAVGTRCWFKLDVEAAEIEVLRGAKAFIESHQPIVFVENHTCLKAGIDQEVRTLMLDFGYTEIETLDYMGSRSHSVYRMVK